LGCSKIEKRSPKNLAELKAAIEEEQNNIEQNTIDNSIGHSRKRMQEVYRIKGKFKNSINYPIKIY